MNSYFYTFGSDPGFPYQNGWVEVRATSREEADRNAADAALKAAEDRMIGYGLSLAPAGIRATLAKGAKVNCATRQKLIDLVLRLDVSTVPR